VSRILFLVSSMQGGGAERVAALLSNHWVAHGHEVILMPTFSGRGECLYPLDERVRLEYLADRVGTTRKTPWSIVRRLLAMRSMVHEWRPDGVVSFLPHVNVAAILAAWGLKVPVMVSERIYPPAMPLRPVWPRLRRWTYPWAATVVMQTRRGADWLAGECPRARGAVIPNPCVYPLPLAQPRLAPEDWVGPARRVVLAVGRLDEQKGFAGLLDAFTRLATRFRDWDLVILGEGEERMALAARIEKQGLAGRVVLPGRVGNPGDWYRRAELYVMSSRFEGFPNTLVEAMAHGVPAVSFDCETGPAEILRDGVDGYLVPPEQGADGLVRAMAVLMEDDETRRSMGNAAVAVRERFSPERVMAAWDGVLGLNKESGDA